jgi:hypothetical protein
MTGFMCSRASLSLIMLGVLLAPGRASAQQVGDFLGSDIPYTFHRSEGVAVPDRLHTALEPIGVHVGSMVLFPKVEIGTGFTSNVYGSTVDRQGDGYFTFGPSATLVSQWSRHFLELTAAAGLKRFATQTVRGETAHTIQADGRFDLGGSGNASNIVWLIKQQRGFEAQFSGAFPQNSAGTVGFNGIDGILRGTFQFNRVSLVASQKFTDLRYSNTTSLSGTPINQQFRNRTEHRSAVRLQYDFNGDIQTFGEVTYTRSIYRFATVDQPLRSNNGVRVIGGINLKITPLIRAVVGAGYEQRIYDIRSYRTLRGLALDARIEWLPTELTTVNLRASRKSEDAINANSPGFFNTTLRARVDHELLRYVLLFAEITSERDSFIAIDRRDKQFSARAGATYSLGRHFTLQPSLTYITRSSTGLEQGQSFKDVRGGVNIVVHW